MTTIKPQIQEAQQTASTRNMKKFSPGWIIIKLSRVTNRNIFKAARERKITSRLD